MIILFAALAAAASPQTAPAPAPTTTTTTTTTTAAAKFTLDTPIETIMADPKAKAVLTADMGGDPSQHPMYDSFKSMSMNQVAPMSGGKITDDMLKKIGADLAAIK